MAKLNFIGMPMPDPDQPGHAEVFLGVAWPLTALSIIFVTLRFYVRRVTKAGWSSDDWLMLLALIFQIISMGIATERCRWGFGKEYVNITMEDYKNLQRYEMIVVPFGYLVSMVARLSIAILLVRIFGCGRQWFKWFMVVFTVFIWLSSIVNIILLYTQVRPLEAFWNTTIKPTYKLSPTIVADVALVLQFFLLVSDILYVVLPVSFVWKLVMSVQRRIGLIVLLSLSLITGVVQAAKIVLIMQAMLGRETFLDGNSLVLLFYIVTFAEQAIVVIMGCAPSLGRLNKVRLPIISSLGGSITSFFSRKTWSSESSRYHDIEMEPKLRTPDGHIHTGNSQAEGYTSHVGKQSVSSERPILNTEKAHSRVP